MGKTPAEIIRGARNVLFERGWYQGALRGPDGTVCTYGALLISQYGNAARFVFTRANSDYEVERDTLGIVLTAAAANGQLIARHGIGPWNDTKERTFNEVIEVLDKAEKLAETREGT